MGQITVTSGPERRRRWSGDQKRSLVLAAFAPGASVAEVAREADVCTGLLYRWRKDFREAGEMAAFAPAVLVDERGSLSAVSGNEAAIVVELGAGARVRIGAGASASLVTATLQALRP